MVKLICIIFIIGGGTYIGLSEVSMLKNRVRLLRQLCDSLTYMESEISFTFAPVASIFSGLEKSGGKMVSAFFGDCSRDLNSGRDEELSVIWREHLQERFGDRLKSEEMECLAQVGKVLGRYDAENQISSLKRLHERLSAYLDAAVHDREKHGRLYGAMGLFISAAIAIVIL